MQNQSGLDFFMLKGFQQGTKSIFGMKPLLQKVKVSSLLTSAALLSWYEYNIQYKYNSSLYCLQLWLHSGFSMVKVFFFKLWERLSGRLIVIKEARGATVQWWINIFKSSGEMVVEG